MIELLIFLKRSCSASTSLTVNADAVQVAILTKSGRSTFSQDVSAARATASRVSSECGDRPACFVGTHPITHIQRLQCRKLRKVQTSITSWSENLLIGGRSSTLNMKWVNPSEMRPMRSSSNFPEEIK